MESEEEQCPSALCSNLILEASSVKIKERKLGGLAKMNGKMSTTGNMKKTIQKSHLVSVTIR